MKNEYLSIQDASAFCNKSVQTLRRALKSKKLKFRKRKTPQGFNYSIEKVSLCEFYSIPMQETVNDTVSQKSAGVREAVEKNVQTEEPKKTITISDEDFKSFAKTMEGLITQHNDERRNFLRLVETLQERIFVLENQLNLLKAPADTKWYQFWK